MRPRPHLTASREWQQWDEDNFASEQHRAMAEPEHHTVPTRPSLMDVWETATIEANTHVDAFREQLIQEHPRADISRREGICLDCMRALLREEIRRRIIAERQLDHHLKGNEG